VSSFALMARLLLAAIPLAAGACSVREPAPWVETEGEIGRHPIVSAGFMARGWSLNHEPTSGGENTNPRL